MSYKDNQDFQFKSQAINKNTAILCNLIKKLKSSLAKLQELQTLYYNKHIKEYIYWPRKIGQLSGKHIKTKQNFRLENKYHSFFEIVEIIENQAYRLKLLVKWRIHLIFQVLFLKKDVIRKKAVDQKIAD